MKDILKYIVPYFLLIIVIIGIRLLELEEYNALVLAFSMSVFIVYYLWIDNPYKTALNLFITSLILCISVRLLPPFEWSSLILNTFIAISALIYLYRFLKRVEKLWIDYLKVILISIGAGLIIIQPNALPALTTTLGFTYILDRLIIRRQMKKITQIIVFSILALFCLSFVIYGQIKAGEAEKSRAAALEEAMQASEAASMARQQAEDAAAHVQKQAALVNKLQAELAECKRE